MGLFGFGKKKKTSSDSQHAQPKEKIDSLPPISTPKNTDQSVKQGPSEVSGEGLTSAHDARGASVSSASSLTPDTSLDSSSADVSSTVSPKQRADSMNATQSNDSQDSYQSSHSQQDQDFQEETALEPEDLPSSLQEEMLQDNQSVEQGLPRFEEAASQQASSSSAHDVSETSFRESEFDFHDLFVEQGRYIKAMTDLKRTRHDFEHRFAHSESDLVAPNEKVGRLLKKLKTKCMQCNKKLLKIDAKLANQKV